MRELVTGFDDQQAAARWLHDRGPMPSRPLTAPDAPSLYRAVLEEHILARLLRHHDSDPAIAAQVPPCTFTADARYDIYAAIIHVWGIHLTGATQVSGAPGSAGRRGSFSP